MFTLASTVEQITHTLADVFSRLDPLAHPEELLPKLAQLPIVLSGIFVAAFMIGAPVLIAVIVVDAAFGVVSRVVPQLNVFAVGFPAKMIVGLVLIGASLPFVVDFLGFEIQDSVRQALRALRVG